MYTNTNTDTYTHTHIHTYRHPSEKLSLISCRSLDTYTDILALRV